MPLHFSDTIFQLPHGPIARDIIVSRYSHSSLLLHQSPPTIQQIWCDTIATRNDGNAGGLVQRFLHDPQFLRR
jgi:hypothetical protein